MSSSNGNQTSDTSNLSYASAQSSIPVIDLESTREDDDSLVIINISSDLENTLLAGGDRNRNPLPSTPKKTDTSTDFLRNEIVTSTPAVAANPVTPQSGDSKRKRAESPEFFSVDEDDSGEGSDEESLSSVSTDNTAIIPSDKTDQTPVAPTQTNQSPAASANVDQSSDKTGQSQGKGPAAASSKKYDEFTGIELPDTVTLLTTEDGARVYLVGTAHFSTESQDDVSLIIRAVNPNIVCIELCKARTNILQLDEKTILEEAKNINMSKIRAAIEQNGLVNGLMYILLLNMSAHLTKELGMAPGGEFRRAVAEVQQMGGKCLIHLSDRPLDVTIKRALYSLSWWQTLKLTWHLIMSKEPISKEEVERCKQRDLLEEMLKEMAGEFPQLGTVFVEERDVYLTYSLQLAAQPDPNKHRDDKTRVVAVVGIGHVPGIVANWGTVSMDDITPLLVIPAPSRTSKVVKMALKASAAGLVIWAVVRYAPRPNLARFR